MGRESENRRNEALIKPVGVHEVDNYNSLWIKYPSRSLFRQIPFKWPPLVRIGIKRVSWAAFYTTWLDKISVRERAFVAKCSVADVKFLLRSAAHCTALPSKQGKKMTLSSWASWSAETVSALLRALFYSPQPVTAVVGRTHHEPFLQQYQVCPLSSSKSASRRSEIFANIFIYFGPKHILHWKFLANKNKSIL